MRIHENSHVWKTWGGQCMENFFHHLKIIHIPICVYILIHENSN